MSAGEVLLDILVVLLAAKVAAEIAERLSIPVVVGEIAAGVIIGPSAVGLVGSSSVLSALGELGVILLLLEVGMSMRLEDLGSVGRAALLVATIGVIVPSIAGLGVGLAFGHDFNVSLFLGAALAATSVGITARVFSDLRALATVEARTVLGAAVADDVMGLVVLTVVVRVAAGGSVSALSVAGIVGVAVAFLVLTTMAGQWLGPRLFGLVDRHALSAGTLVAIALAFTLAVAKLADLAKLAPIVGAFIAGVSLSGSEQRERIERDLRPVGHLFIPVFFLEIGIDARVEEFFRPAVLGIAAALLVVAVAGKLVAAAGALGSPGDKPLIGLGMIPRGEVGLIFASIGIQDHVLGRDLYAALLLVVLVSTMITPPLLRWRLVKLRSRAAATRPETPRPPQGWLEIHDQEVTLAAEPPERLALLLGLETAVLLKQHRPASALLDWFGDLDPERPLHWDDAATSLLFQVLLEGGVRSWRFLETTGLLQRALPELSAALERRRADPYLLDPNQVLQFTLVDRIRELARADDRVTAWWSMLSHPEWLLLAALILDTAGREAVVEAARNLVKRLDLGANAEEEVALLVGQSNLLRAASERVNGLSEEVVLELASYLETRERAGALGVLSASSGSLSATDRGRLDGLVELVLRTLSEPSLTGRDARNLVESRRLQAITALGDQSAEADRIRTAPRAYVLSQGVPELVRQARLLEPLPRRGDARVWVYNFDIPGEVQVEFASRDRIGLLAVTTAVLTDHGLDVREALAATWPDGGALESFRVVDRRDDKEDFLDPKQLEHAMRAALLSPLQSAPEPEATVTFDDEGSPWYTLTEVRAPDRLGLLHDITAAFAVAGANVHSATIETTKDTAIGRFQLTDRNDRRLDPALKAAVIDELKSGVSVTQRKLQHRAGLLSRLRR